MFAYTLYEIILLYTHVNDRVKGNVLSLRDLRLRGRHLFLHHTRSCYGFE